MRTRSLEFPVHYPPSGGGVAERAGDVNFVAGASRVTPQYAVADLAE